MRPLIILHGAWLQPAHYDEVTQHLRHDGIDVTVPDLAGHSLAGSTRLVQDLIDQAAEAPVVLAHSFGGVTATGLKGISHLLYLSSFVFDIGENAQQWIARIEQETGRQAAPLPLTVDDAGLTRLDPAGARDGLFADCTTEVADRAIDLLRPEPATIFTDTPAHAAWKDTPSTYIAATEDKAILPEMVAYFTQRCGTSVAWPSGHCPFLSRPADVVALVRDHL
ncbi:alpha/beta fold hydrolase [Nocardia sp. NPDC050175]|uniref:alpha/beta fold hydrolase n=1 Tax=Nocardia sp. NPDC050175 TaxID=3364317 RepID=UPI0037A11075